MFPQGQFFIEASILLGYACLSYYRLMSGIKGNRIERKTEMTIMLLLAIFTSAGNIYFLFFQTYILVIEVVLQIAALAFTLIEVILGLIAMLIFNSLAKDKRQ